MKFKIINEGLRNDFKYYLDYEYDGRPCYDETCGCRTGNDYCRSNEYDNLRIEEVHIPSLVAYFLSKTNKKKDVIETKNVDFLNYCVDRLLRIHKLYETDYWDIQTCGGYYGQEIDLITLNDLKFKLICEKIQSLIVMFPNERIEFILMEEYGYVLDSLKGKKFKLIETDVSNLKIGNEVYYKKIEDAYYKDYPYPIGVYIKEGEFFKLVDGYHRYKSIIKNKKKVEIIVAS